ncbi:MAG: triose-phosphate isomerase [Bacteroidales bacterium]|nr:triose-phosphate isomerase [Bacteroidales bacterium]
MRKKIVAGNWKMNTTIKEAEVLVKDLTILADELDTDVDIIVCPPFTHLDPVARMLAKQYDENEKISLGAQNCADHVSGAYTGEVSVSMLKSVNCKYVILGHSERREYYHENSASLYEKVELALNAGIIPIFCVGEKLEERESNRHFEVVAEQVKDVLYKLKGAEMSKIIIAYEPVWAIGTGKTATSEQAEEMHAFIRKVVADKFGDVAEIVPILYGGSCKPSNAQEIFSKPNVDGGLIGGASLVAKDFVDIVKSF